MQKVHISGWRSAQNLLKMYFWILISNIKVTCIPIASFTFLPFSVNLFLFQFLSRGIRMHISTQTGVQIGQLRRWENGQILIKKLLWKLLFQDEGHLYGNCLFYILSIYCKCPLYQFLSRNIRMHIFILTGV